MMNKKPRRSGAFYYGNVLLLSLPHDAGEKGETYLCTRRIF